MQDYRVILASASPRRRELLAAVFPAFTVCEANIDENIPFDTPERLAETLARGKAEAVSAQNPDALVVGADTVVALDGAVYGKPADREDAARMLRELSGKTHRVVTGVCVRIGSAVCSGTETSLVTFRDLSEDFIRRYVATGIPMDKAGAYAVQCEPSPVDHFQFNVDNIIGLPVQLVRELSERADRAHTLRQKLGRE